MIVRATEHVAALEHAALAGFSNRGPCRSKQRRPPHRRHWPRPTGSAADRPGPEVVVDFADYVTAAQARAAGLPPVRSDTRPDIGDPVSTPTPDPSCPGEHMNPHQPFPTTLPDAIDAAADGCCRHGRDCQADCPVEGGPAEEM